MPYWCKPLKQNGMYYLKWPPETPGRPRSSLKFLYHPYLTNNDSSTYLFLVCRNRSIVTNMKIGVNPLDNKKNCKVVFYLILNKTEIQITYVMN